MSKIGARLPWVKETMKSKQDEEVDNNEEGQEDFDKRINDILQDVLAAKAKKEQKDFELELKIEGLLDLVLAVILEEKDATLATKKKKEMRKGALGGLDVSIFDH
jgi:hypothetical protein